MYDRQTVPSGAVCKITTTNAVFIYFVSGDLAKSIRTKTDLHFGAYHSLYEWFNPLYLDDKKNNFQTNNYVTVKNLLFNIRTQLFVGLHFILRNSQKKIELGPNTYLANSCIKVIFVPNIQCDFRHII